MLPKRKRRSSQPIVEEEEKEGEKENKNTEQQQQVEEELQNEKESVAILPTTKEIQEMLDENDYFIQAIKEYHSQGRASIAFEFQKRLNKNLNTLLQIYHNQKLKTAVQPSFQIVSKPPTVASRKKQKPDPPENSATPTPACTTTPSSLDMPILNM